ncbi:hypothetical protein BTA51_27665 [Hahella sp. CCB-MM4]|nr:hypothetical protein BTA51_27665 [Hahella sp. CCB-MM4]
MKNAVRFSLFIILVGVIALASVIWDAWDLTIDGPRSYSNFGIAYENSPFLFVGILVLNLFFWSGVIAVGVWTWVVSSGDRDPKRKRRS